MIVGPIQLAINVWSQCVDFNLNVGMILVLVLGWKNIFFTKPLTLQIKDVTCFVIRSSWI